MEPKHGTQTWNPISFKRRCCHFLPSLRETLHLWGHSSRPLRGEIVKSPTNALNLSEFRVATLASTEIWPEILGDAGDACFSFSPALWLCHLFNWLCHLLKLKRFQTCFKSFFKKFQSSETIQNDIHLSASSHFISSGLKQRYHTDIHHFWVLTHYDPILEVKTEFAEGAEKDDKDGPRDAEMLGP